MQWSLKENSAYANLVIEDKKYIVYISAVDNKCLAKFFLQSDDNKLNEIPNDDFLEKLSLKQVLDIAAKKASMIIEFSKEESDSNVEIESEKDE